MKVGIIGTGLMGFPMAINLAKKFELKSFNRTFEKMKGLEKYKITLCNTLESLSKDTDVIISMLPGDKEVIETIDQIKNFIQANKKKLYKSKINSCPHSSVGRARPW